MLTAYSWTTYKKAELILLVWAIWKSIEFRRGARSLAGHLVACLSEAIRHEKISSETYFTFAVWILITSCCKKLYYNHTLNNGRKMPHFTFWGTWKKVIPNLKNYRIPDIVDKRTAVVISDYKLLQISSVNINYETEENYHFSQLKIFWNIWGN